MRLTYLPLFILLAVLLGACDQAEKEPVNRDIVVQILSEPQSLHPTNGRSGSRVNILFFTNQHLTRLDPTTEEQTPLLAIDLPEVSADGLEYTYQIDPAATWEDGSPITGMDVMFSVKAAVCPLLTVKAGLSYFEKMDEIRLYPDEPGKLTLAMKEKYVGNLYIMNSIYIIDRRFFDPNGLLDRFSLEEMLGRVEGVKVEEDSAMINWANEFNDAKYGRNPEFIQGTSGPYKVTEWVPEQRIVLSRRENYWGKDKAGALHQQYPDNIIFQSVTDDNSLELLLKQQEIDVATRIPTASFNRLLENETATEHFFLEYQQRDGYAYIALNTRPDGVNHKPIFSDKKVRYAFNYLVPIEDFISEFYDDRAVRITSPVSILSKEYNENIEPLPFNPDSAVALLEAAGWKDSDGDLIRDKMINGEKVDLSISLTYPAGRQSIEDMVQRMVLEGEKVGMKIEHDPVAFQVLASRVPGHDFDATMLGASNSILPYDFKQNWTSATWMTGENFTGFGDPETDQLIEAARVELDPVKRKQMVDQIQQIIYDYQPAVFCFNTTNNMAIHRRFDHAEMYRIRPYIMFNNLKLKE